MTGKEETGIFTLYSDVEATAVRWLWYPFIAVGKITLLQGDLGDGKSTMMMNLIAELSKGGTMPDGKQVGIPQKVIYQCSEDDASDTIKPRLETCGTDCRNVAFINEELFAHLRDPAIVIRKDSITFNTACITGLEDVVYVHVMFNNDLKRIVVRGCDENDKDALRWCIAKPDKRKSRKMSCKPFAELVYKEMDWDSECRYKVLGYRITFEGETLYVFDLLVPEIFHERQKRKEETVAEQPADQETKPVDTRKGFYPDDIAGTFGVPVEEHLRESEVR